MCVLEAPDVLFFSVSELMGAGVDSEYAVPEVPALYNPVQFSWKLSSHVTVGKSPHPQHCPIPPYLNFPLFPLPSKEIPFFFVWQKEVLLLED